MNAAPRQRIKRGTPYMINMPLKLRFRFKCKKHINVSRDNLVSPWYSLKQTESHDF